MKTSPREEIPEHIGYDLRIPPVKLRAFQLRCRFISAAILHAGSDLIVCQFSVNNIPRRLSADLVFRNLLRLRTSQLLRIRIEKQAAERAKLLRIFSEYIDAIFPEVSGDQEILQEAEARIRPLPPAEFID